MSFLGDFLLPKHLFRQIKNVGASAIPEPDEDGKRHPGKALKGFGDQIAVASQAIGNRIFVGKAWANRTILRSSFTVGGLVVLLAWSLWVVGLLTYGYLHLLRGFQHVKHTPGLRPDLTIPLGQVPALPSPSGPPAAGGGVSAPSKQEGPATPIPPATPSSHPASTKPQGNDHAH